MKKLLISVITLCVMAFVVAAGFTPAEAQNSPARAPAASATENNHKAYTTVEQCFECHGSYAEHAQTTASFGLWNPHDSIHGGYVDCMNCHTYNRLDRNYCAFCHEYKPDTQKK